MKEYIDKIIRDGKQEDMDCLEDILVDLLYDLKEREHGEYRKCKNKIKGMAYDYQIDEELAIEIVEDMKPLGEYWNMDTVKSVIGNDNHRIEDMYVVMNSLANDYQGVVSLEQAETYVKMARAWLDDIDAHKNKVWWYFIK